jgi:hypothetical protein
VFTDYMFIGGVLMVPIVPIVLIVPSISRKNRHSFKVLFCDSVKMLKFDFISRYVCIEAVHCLSKCSGNYMISGFMVFQQVDFDEVLSR